MLLELVAPAVHGQRGRCHGANPDHPPSTLVGRSLTVQRRHVSCGGDRGDFGI